MEYDKMIRDLDLSCQYVACHYGVRRAKDGLVRDGILSYLHNRGYGFYTDVFRRDYGSFGEFMQEFYTRYPQWMGD